VGWHREGPELRAFVYMNGSIFDLDTLSLPAPAGINAPVVPKHGAQDRGAAGAGGVKIGPGM